MTGFVVKRLLAGLLVVFIVATLTFFIMHSVPGGPFDTEKKFPPEIKCFRSGRLSSGGPIRFGEALLRRCAP